MRKVSDMKNKLKILVFFIILTLSSTTVFADSNVIKKDKNTIEKTYKYVSNGENKKDKSIEKKIKYDGKEYVLKDIKYDNKPIEIKEKVKVENKEDYLKIIEKDIYGKRVKFKAKGVKWDDKEKISLSESIEYQNRGDIKNEIEKDGHVLKLENITSKTKTETFNAPAVFYSYDKDTNEYIFEGKTVHIGNTPLWDGYQRDIKEYLGINGNDYSILGGTFTSENILVDESTNLHQRTAIYRGSKIVPYYLATYQFNGEDNLKEHEGEITYVADGYYKTNADVTYTVTESLMAKILKYGLGILVLGTAVALILFLLKKKKKEDN